jgi:hypothetical protein
VSCAGLWVYVWIVEMRMGNEERYGEEKEGLGDLGSSFWIMERGDEYSCVLRRCKEFLSGGVVRIKHNSFLAPLHKLRFMSTR